MLKRIGLVAVLVGVALVGCGKKDVAVGEDAAAAGVVAGASGVVGKEVVKVGAKVEAKYDPNLKVENVVWDSPEKKAMFEKMMAGKGVSASGVVGSASAVVSGVGASGAASK